jgi:hypothetical protein
MHLTGVLARFNDPESHAKVYAQSCDHSISAFVIAAERAKLRFAAMSEHRVADGFVRTDP